MQEKPKVNIFKFSLIMKHIVYLSPNAPELDGHGALHGLESSASTSPLETLKALRKRTDEEVLIFDSPEQFAEAFNDETISDQGYILVIDDHISDHNRILNDIRKMVSEKGVTIPGAHPCKVITLLPSNDLNWHKEKEAGNTLRALSEELPTYLVASNRDGEWFEEKVRRVVLSDSNKLSFVLEDGFTVDASEVFIENLASIKDILKGLDKDAVKEFHEKYA